MRYTSSTIRKLADAYKEIDRLGKIGAVLGWDLNVHLPPKGSAARAEQSALITAIIADRWHSARFRTLFEKAVSQKKKLSAHERALVRNLEHSATYYYKIPTELIVEFSKTTSEGFMAWQQARKDDDFSLFSSHLARIVKLNQMMADHIGYSDDPYDALLDMYEPGLTTAFCDRLFHSLVAELRPLVSKITASKQYSKTPSYVGKPYFYSKKLQEKMCLFILRKLGYDLHAGRLDVSSHPFTTDFDRLDVRITTRYNRSDFRESLLSTIHEAGHALYEQGVSSEYDGTPLSSGVSLGIHESQSRFWENQVGRSESFVQFLTPVLQAFFPDQLIQASSTDIYLLFNHVAPGLIRTEADEVTYNLHIALRFEIEHALINNRIAVSDLPEVWREKMKEYVGIIPETNADGVLQDVHWSYGNFGYFPTYTLGNLYAAQFTKKMQEEIDISACTAQGDFGTVLSWLRATIHEHGSLYWPDELVKNITGEPLNPAYFIAYLKEKYTKIYEL